jgi:hypothetical protein
LNCVEEKSEGEERERAARAERQEVDVGNEFVLVLRVKS